MTQFDTFTDKKAQSGNKLENQIIVTPTTMGLTGWISDDGSPDSADNLTLYAADSTHLTCAGDYTARFNVATKMSWSDSGGTKYGLVRAVFYSPASPVTGVSTTVATDLFNKTSHGLSDGNAVIPTGMVTTTNVTNGTIYYVVSSTANTFKLALTLGGAAIDLTGSNDSTVITITAATNIALMANTDYTVAASAITAPRHSFAEKPQGYPGRWNFTSGVTGFSSTSTNVAIWATFGRFMSCHFYIVGTSNATAHTVTVPVTINATATEAWGLGYGFNNGATSTGTWGQLNTTTVSLYTSVAQAAWTAANASHHRFTITFPW